MEAMGGTLTATSAEGQGTAFTLDLALGDRPADEDDLPPPELPALEPVAGPEHTILYVEDNPSNLRLVERVLAHRGGVRLLTAPEGEIVQELVREQRPDLVLLDLHLPGIDGEEVLRRLRADPRAADYLTKPLDVPRFLEVVNGLLVAATR